MNTSPDHPDFTALALGEHINGIPAQAVLDALRTSVSARHEADQIRATANQLAFVLKGQPPVRLDDARRNAIFNADVAAVRARFSAEDCAALAEEPGPVVERAPRTWIYPTLAAAAVAVAAIIVMKFLPSPADVQKEAPPIATENDEPTGRIMVESPTPNSPVRERNQGPGIGPVIVEQGVKPPLPDKGPALSPANEPPVQVVKEAPPPRPLVPSPLVPNSPPPESDTPPPGISPPTKILPGSFATPPKTPGKPGR